MAYALVFLGYLAFCGVVLSATVVLAAKTARRPVIAVAIVAVLLAWPVWAVLGNKALFALACEYGGVGPHVHGSFRVDRVTFNHAYHWSGADGFLERCGGDCLYEIQNSPFNRHPFQSALRQGSVQVEDGWVWQYRFTRPTRMWFAPLGSPQCFATIRDAEKEGKCLALEELPAITAPFVMKLHKRPTSFLGVTRHQDELLRDGKVLARFVTYRSSLFNGLMPYAACPASLRDEDAFWTRVLGPAGI